MKLLDKAIEFAVSKHKGQERKSWPVSYIFHPLEVAYQLAKLGITDESTLCGAVLHDTLEDTQTTSEELVYIFGEKIALIVWQLSCFETMDKVAYINSFGESSFTCIESLVIKIMDRTCNIKDCLAAGKTKWARNMFTKGVSLWDYLELRSEQLDGVFGSNTSNTLCSYFEKQRKKFERLKP